MRKNSINRLIRKFLGVLLITVASALLLTGCPAAPTAAFQATPTEGDAPLTVNFLDESTQGGAAITSRLWDFGDGSQSVDQNPVHTFTKSGFYRVTLRVSNSGGTGTETKESYINVRAVPVAAFSASPQTGSTPLTVQFQDDSIATPYTASAWRWTFGDGEVSTERNPVHIYEQPGAYNVSLTVSSDGGSDTESRKGFIVVSELPKVTFQATPITGPIPLSVTFKDTTAPGSAPVDSWHWDFGDEGSSTEQHPTYIYTTPGIYSVTLVTRTAAGESSGSQNNLITVTEAPVAAFSGSPTSGGTPLVVRFADESMPGTSPVKEWLWNFGDGTSSTQRSPLHEFSTAGLYDITLTVTTDAGTNTVKKEGYITAQAPPLAGFTAKTRRGTAPLTVEFLDASVPGAAPISGRQWNFGDSAISGDVNPVHVFTQPGIYTVSLLVESSVGSNVYTEPSYIEVVSTPDANFTATPTVGESPLSVVFTDTSLPGTSPITTWLWDFGDGTTSDKQHPTRVYGSTGTYTVKLSVTSQEGTNTETRQNFVRVRVLPTVDFTADNPTGAAPFEVQFRDASLAGSEQITGRAWDFGDGGVSSAEDPRHTYTKPGSYTVTLNLSTATGTVSKRKADFIKIDPVVSFTHTADSDRAPAFVSFTNTTDTGPLAITSQLWDFGDGQTSDAPNPIHSYAKPGVYDVSLTITTEGGESVLLKEQVVKLRPNPEFSGEPLSGVGGPFAVQFQDLTVPGAITIKGWDWNFGDGGHSSLQNPAHSFARPGLYPVSLTILTDIGNSTTVRTNYVSIRPRAAFSADKTTGEDNLTVQFTDTTDPGSLAIVSWQWTFGDNGSSTVRNPIHAYTQPGTYTVTLTTNSNEGSNKATKAGYIVVTPDVTFSASAVAGEAPFSVNFSDQTNAGTLTISKRSWNVGEGEPIEEEAPTHIYETPGIYDVALSITTAQGVKTETLNDFITVLPTLAATPTITPGVGSASVQFANSSAVGTLTGATWEWDFGDMTTSADLNPTHSYTTPGRFPVMLTVTTAEGVTFTKTVTTIDIDPIPSFTTDISNGAVPLTVQFTDSSTVGNLDVSAWAWDFGDGGTSTLQDPQHTYAAAGTYAATLTITTVLGNTPVATPTTVKVIPAPDFTGTPVSGPPPLNVSFANTTVLGGATLDSLTWNFGDGGTSTMANPSHSYTTPGTYTVGLTIQTSEGSGTESKVGYIAVNPIPSFTASGSSGASPFTVNFTDTTPLGSVTPTGYLWNFGDGSTSTLQNPSHTYVAAGLYTVTMQISSTQGQVTATQANLITVNPDVKMSTSPSSGPVPLTVTFTDITSLGNLSVTDWMWNFGDGSGTVTTQVNSTSHTYTTPGNYSPTLTLVTSGGNFSGGLATPLQVNPVPTFSADYRSGPGTFTVTFTDNTSLGSVNTTSRAWDFGDGGTTTTANASITHTYATAGTYDVTMTLTTDIQGTLAKTESDYITANPLTYTVTGGTSGTATHAITVANSTTVGDLPILTTQWNYGDGSSQTPSTSHSYTAAGSYQISMIVTTAQGSQTYTGPTPINVAPPIVFAADLDEGPGVLDVTFTDASAPGSLVISSRRWDFGDGTFVVVNAPTTTVTHQYTNTGASDLVRQASLSLNTNIGALPGDTTEAITIHPVTLTGDATNQPHNLLVNFTDTTTPGDISITSRFWTFKDGATTTTAGATTNHTYTAAGSYPVALTITTSQGNMATGSIGTAVLVRPVVQYAATSSVTGLKPHTVNFQDQTVLGNLTGVSRTWNWGDGTSSTVSGASTSHSYTTAGCFEATMTLVTTEGSFSDNSLAIRATAEDLSSFAPPTTGNNSQAGIMFDIIALKDLTVTSFTINLTGNTGQANNLHTYVAGTTSYGFESNPAVWVSLGNPVVTSGTNLAIDTLDVPMSTGNRYAYYLINTSAVGTGNYVNYQNGTGMGDFNDGNIRLITNAGRSVGSANDFDGTIFAQRWFVGSVTYQHELTCNLKRGGLFVAAQRYTTYSDDAQDTKKDRYPTIEGVVPAAVTADGGRVALGDYSAAGTDGDILIRTDRDLNTLWELDLEWLAFDEIYDIRSLAQGDILIYGATALNGTEGETLVVRLNAAGELRWEQVLAGVAATSVRALAETAENDLLILSALGNSEGYLVPTVTVLDRYSNVGWSSSLPAVSDDHGWGIFEGRDGTIQVYGSSSNYEDDTTAWMRSIAPTGALIAEQSAE